MSKDAKRFFQMLVDFTKETQPENDWCGGHRSDVNSVACHVVQTSHWHFKDGLEVMLKYRTPEEIMGAIREHF